MKQYRLKKWYPSLPKYIEEGIIVTRFKDPDCYSPSMSKLESELELPISEVEGNQEYWEEVYTKDYRILSYTTEEGYLYNWNEITEEYDLQCSIVRPKDFKPQILEVMRLKDEQVFRLGDEVDRSLCSDTIIAFFENGMRIEVWFENGMQNHIGDLQLVPQPLFITDDNVEIYDGEDFYVVKGDKILESVAPHFSKNRNNYKRYKHRFNAVRQIVHNEPLLSLTDLKQCLREGQSYQYHETTLNNAIKLMEQKIK